MQSKTIQQLALYTVAFLVGAIFVVLWLNAPKTWVQPAEAGEANTTTYAGTQAVPEFPSTTEWVNSAPLSWDALRGKVVLLDFWTYGCINCIHIIPDLKRLEDKYAEHLVVIGVHSAKYDREKNTSGIRHIIDRYDLHHPVVNDKDFEIWRSFGARAWPTLVLVDPAGKFVGKLEGEGHFARLDHVIAQLLKEFEGRLSDTRIDVTQSDASSRNTLHYPGKVTADAKRIAVSNTGGAAIWLSDRAGQVQQVIGSGKPGFADGDFTTAQFRDPQGLVLADTLLYVADTGNHALREIDLTSQTVRTLIGDGAQHRLSLSEPNTLGLNSPWDLLLHDGQLYIAMAGQHQIWRWDISTKTLHHFAGSGREELKDGSLTRAGLNQPSGLATDGLFLYVADSEANAIRRMPLFKSEGLKKEVITLLGTGLFDFGDRDGAATQAQLQHPVGLSFHEGVLYVADTYNHKVKRFNLKSGHISTWLSDAQGLNEPGGVHVWGDRIWVANTNGHSVALFTLSDTTKPVARTLQWSWPNP